MNPFLRTLGYLKPYRLYITLSVICTIGFVLFSAFSITLVMPFLDSLFGTNVSQITSVASLGEGESSSGNSFIKKAEAKLNSIRAKTVSRFNAIFKSDSKKRTLFRLCLFLVLSFLFKNIFSFGHGFFSTLIQQGVIRDLRRHIFQHLQNQSLSYYHKEKVGNLVSRTTNDVFQIDYSITAVLTSFSKDPFLILVFLFIMFVLSWKLTLFSLLVVPVLGLVMSIVGSSIRKYTMRAQERMADMASLLIEGLSGIKVIKAFRAQEHMMARFISVVNRNRTAMLKREWISGISSPANELLGVITGSLLLWFGGIEVLKGTTGLTGGGFMLFLFAMFSTIQPLKNIGQLWPKIKHGTAAAERIFQILDVAPTVIDSASAISVSRFENAIEIKDVWFSYIPDRWVLKNISGRVPKGKVVALVGPSGSGKSTLADLVLRFYDPGKGMIAFDGQDLRDLRTDSLREQMGVVTQETTLFHDTIQSNIAFGMDHIDSKKLKAAAKAANADKFIKEMPEKYDTIIGDRGVRISGGQRQRIAIARAVLRDPPILILDEATSSLDTESERLVQESIDKLMENRTVLVIAHRLSTVQNADEIWVLDKGEIIDRGSHSDLAGRCDLYARLSSLQFSPAPQ